MPHPFDPKRALAVVAGLLLAVVLGGCASLPPRPTLPPTTAPTDTTTTTLGRLAAASMAGAPSGQSGFRLLPTGDFAFDARIALARRAERTLDVQYYQIARDDVGLQLLRELRNAAQRGVRVRLLVDDLYTGGEDELFRSLAAVPNVEVRLFNPFPSRSPTVIGRVLLSLHEFTRVNHRMHNKLFIADNRFSVSGGRNMADEYFMRSAHANFIDMDVLSAGPIVRALSQAFDRYWNSTVVWPVQTVVPLHTDEATAVRRFDEMVEGVAPEFEAATSDLLGHASVDFELSTGRAQLQFATASVFADRPNKTELTFRDDTVSTVTRSVVEELRSASSELLIASPYFIPGEVGMAALREARGKGIAVKVLTNGVGATDEPLVHFRYARYRREMLELGVELYEVSPFLGREDVTFGDFGQSFRRLHAKVAVIDRKKAFIGSMNFDARSAWSNTEAGILIESPQMAETLNEMVERDNGETIYRLRLRKHGEIEWVWRGSGGEQRTTTDEPNSSWLLRLKMFLLEPFASEELL